jgi:hypothetical protein
MAQRGGEETGGDDERARERDDRAARGRETHPHHGSDGTRSRTRAGTEPDNLLESSTMGEEATVARALWRAEEARWSRAALEQWEHGRGLVDVLRDVMHRGDEVSFVFANVTWSGRLVAVGDDLARVDRGHDIVEIRLGPDAPFVLRTRVADGDGCRGDGTATTFAARLRELDGTGVCIGACAGAHGELLEGALRIGRDQVRVVNRAGDRAYVPLASIWWVRAVDD